MTRHRGRRAWAAVVLVPALLLTAPTTSAAGATSVMPHSLAMSPASDAATASAMARQMRREVAVLLQQYIDQYRDRFTDAEIAQLLAYKGDADRKLAEVVLAANRLRYLTSQGASRTRITAAASRATGSWARAKARAEASWAGASSIIEPHLSLLEKLAALRDYNQMMDRFDEVGRQIRSVTQGDAG